MHALSTKENFVLTLPVISWMLMCPIKEVRNKLQAGRKVDESKMNNELGSSLLETCFLPLLRNLKLLPFMGKLTSQK